ncbi:hypothetical protein ACTRXD_17615 [Nitrospira sp. T9]|uniref:hypothetical protein n=1 Tax=unclassified Nitrospira TaxID=2652172 RepID=UPI003F9BE55B
MPENLPSVGVTRLIGTAVNFALVGLVCVLLFLWHGMGAWSMGLGMFVGMPLLVIALLLYVVAVARDMKRRGAL